MATVTRVTWANVKLGAIVRAGEVWATVLSVQPHIHDRAETGVDLWVTDRGNPNGRGKIVSLEVMPDDLVAFLG